MPKIFLGVLIFITFLLWSCKQNFFKSNNIEDEVELESMKKSNIKEPDSENNEIWKSMANRGLKEFYQTEDISCENSNRKYENLVKTLDNYIQRYISLFLIISNLLEYQVKDLNELITLDLELNLSGEDLAYLQGFSKSGKESTYIKNLSKLDTILSNIARQKKRSFMEHALRYSKSFIMDIVFKIFKNPIFNHYLPLLVIILVIYFCYMFIIFKPFVFAGILINSLIIWDSLNLYWKRIKEVDLNIYVRAMQFKEIPQDCDPLNMNWYQRVLSFVIENRCLQYYQNMNKNPVEEVSLFKCVLDTYGSYLIRTPVKILGASIRDFTGEIGELWPWPFNCILSAPLAPTFTVFALFFILVLCGKRFRFSFWGAAIELGEVKQSIATEANTAGICDSAAKGGRDLRKLKPWTHTRLPKRLDRDFGTRGKSLLRALKYFSMMPNDVIKNASDFNESNAQHSNVNSDVKLIDKAIKND